MTTPLLKVRDLLRLLARCDLDADVWVTTAPMNELTDPDTRSLVVGVEFIDDDSEEAREIGRKKYGTPYLREPVLHIEPNQ